MKKYGGKAVSSDRGTGGLLYWGKFNSDSGIGWGIPRTRLLIKRIE